VRQELFLAAVDRRGKGGREGFQNWLKATKQSWDSNPGL